MQHLEISDVPGGVTVIRLNRPPMNALCGELLQELAKAVDEIGAAGTTKALVLWGGEKVFAAGADVTEFTPIDTETARIVAANFRNACDRLAAFNRPTIAAITGFALGGGLELALACDFRVCGDNARMGFPEIQLGIIPGGGGTQRAARLIGPARAKDLIFSGRHVRGPEAREMGLVDRVVDPQQVYASAIEWATSLASGAVVAMGHAKAVIDRGLEVDLAAGLDLEADGFAAAFETGDGARGIESFIANGPGKATFEGN